MPDLAALINSLNTPGLRLATGICVGGRVFVDGGPVPCTWLSHVKALSGDRVSLLVGAGAGLVLGVLAGGRARPVFARVTSSTRTRLRAMLLDDTLAGDGKSVDIISNNIDNPPVGAWILIDWAGGVPVLVAVVDDLPPVNSREPARFDVPEPANPLTLSAVDTATWVAGTGRFSDRLGGGVFQKAPSMIGMFFYDNPGVLREAAGLYIFLPARRRAGDMSSPVAVKFQPHNLAAATGTPVVNPAVGKAFTVPAGWGGGWIPLGQDFARAIPPDAPWGIALTGTDYVGFDGVNSRAESGMLKAT